MVIESQKMLLKYVSSLAPPHFFLGLDVPLTFCTLETPLSTGPIFRFGKDVGGLE